MRPCCCGPTVRPTESASHEPDHLGLPARWHAYLDIARRGQTVNTRAVPLSGGQAELAVDLTPDLYGTLELHAYKILSDGNITRDTGWCSSTPPPT